MTSSHLALERLPPQIFENLVQTEGENYDEFSGATMQRRICNKLKSYSRKIGGRSRNCSIKQVGNFLKIPEVSLVVALDPLLTLSECRELRRRICSFCAAKPSTMLQILHANSQLVEHVSNAGDEAHDELPQVSFISSGIPSLDKLLNGGFRVGIVSEIVARAGMGKTQLAMQVCVETAKQGMSAAYIETEGKFSLPRLQEIVSKRVNGSDAYTHLPNNYRSSEKQKQSTADVLSRVLVYSATNIHELHGIFSAVEVEACLRTGNDCESSVPTNPIGVLVLDSIAAPARRDFGGGEVASRAQTIMKLANTLKRMAESLRMAVIVVNQIGGSGFQQETETPSDRSEELGALGNSWHHCASTRLSMTCTRAAVSSNSAELIGEISVTKSSMISRGGVAFVTLDVSGFRDASAIIS